MQLQGCVWQQSWSTWPVSYRSRAEKSLVRCWGTRWAPGHLAASEKDGGWQGGGERRAFCFPYNKGADCSYVSQMVMTTAFCNGGGYWEKGEPATETQLTWLCVIRALIFKMVIYCWCSSKGHSMEDHHWDVKLFPFLGSSHYFINLFFFFTFLKCPLRLSLTGSLKKRILQKSLFFESFQIFCKIACIVGSYFFCFTMLFLNHGW